MKNQTWKFGWVVIGQKTEWKYGTAEEAEEYYKEFCNSKENSAVWFCIPVEPKTSLESWGISA